MGALRELIDHLTGLEQPYFAVDGGSGAALLAQLPAMDDRLRPADSPHHADLLVVVEPITDKLLDAVLETYGNLASPRHVVVVGPCGIEQYGVDAPFVRLEDHLPVTARVAGADITGGARSTADAITRAIRRERHRERIEPPPREPEETLIPIRAASEKEIATEDLVLSIGPVQRVTAGPVRLLLVMDGEQVVRAEVRSGYAEREIERLFRSRSWSDGVSLATLLDPLAPLSGRSAYLQALESLHGIVPPPRGRLLRERALRIERATSHAFWLVRFSDLLAYDRLIAEARRIASGLAAMASPPEALIPGGWDRHVDARSARHRDPAGLREAIARLTEWLRSDRLFGLRTREVGVLPASRAREVGVSGPILRASETAEGDARARTLARLEQMSDDLVQAARFLDLLPEGRERAHWSDAPPPVGAAESQVPGPRGTITLQLESQGGYQPHSVRWARPSALHLAMVPELLPGHTLPDALATVASLDLSMAEADG